MSKKKKRKAVASTLSKIVDITVYNEESYFKCFPQATEDDYLNYLLKDELEMIEYLEIQSGI